MNYKKFFMPIVSDGDDLKNRISGAILVSKYFKVQLEILHSIPGVKVNRQLPKHIIEELENFAKDKQTSEAERFHEILLELSKNLDIKISKTALENEPSVHALIQLGDRSSLVAQESKYADLVIMAAPYNGEINESFEAAVLHSGKSVFVIPRELKEFNPKKIVIAWNNSQEAARAITSSIDILKKAEKVHLVSSPEYLSNSDNLDKIKAYLKLHNIEITYELLKTTLHPGEALLNRAHSDGYDMIVIGAYGHDGLKELMFGGATKYLLKNSTIPMFMSH